MSELGKDLLNILTKEVVRWGDDAETRKTGAYFLAARLEEMGYVKVGAVKEQIISSFKEWRAHYPESVFLPRPVGEHSPTFDGCAGRTMRAMLPAIEKSLLRDIDELPNAGYCSEGERVVAKDATGEEGESNGEAKAMSPMP